ncbi:uncharacterized protein TNCV_4888021 [Trichonephila clavipes]|nr:uncharacterized protein TNCV_4888021 [Trichonephila clavipes]
MDEILTTASDLELEVNEDGIEELIMGHENELTIEELQEILNEEHQETQRNVSPSEQEEDERGRFQFSVENFPQDGTFRHAAFPHFFSLIDATVHRRTKEAR